MNTSTDFIFEIKDDPSKESWLRVIEQAVAVCKKE